MLDYTKFRNIIETGLETNLPGVDIVFENTELNPNIDSHVELTIDDTKSEKLDLAGTGHKIEGNFRFEIKVPVGSGSAGARDTAEQIVSVLKSLTDSEQLVTGNPEFSSDGEEEDTGLYVFVLDVSFTYLYG